MTRFDLIPSVFQLVDAKGAFNVLKARVNKQERVSTRAFRSIGELESLGSDLSTTLGRQGLELVRLDESRCRCVPSDSGSYFTPGIVGEGSHSGRALPTYSVGAVGTPSGSRTLSVSSDGIPEAPLENVIAIRVLVSSQIIPFCLPMFLTLWL